MLVLSINSFVPAMSQTQELVMNQCKLRFALLPVQKVQTEKLKFLILSLKPEEASEEPCRKALSNGPCPETTLSQHTKQVCGIKSSTKQKETKRCTVLHFPCPCVGFSVVEPSANLKAFLFSLRQRKESTKGKFQRKKESLGNSALLSPDLLDEHLTLKN